MENYTKSEHQAAQKFIALAKQMRKNYYDMIYILDSIDGELITSLMNLECPDKELNSEMYEAYDMTFAPLSFDELSLGEWVDIIETIYDEYYRQ